MNEREREAGRAGFSYEEMPDEEALQARESPIDEKGFFILPSELFGNVRKRAKRDENLDETLANMFKDSSRGSQSEDDFAGLFDD